MKPCSVLKMNMKLLPHPIMMRLTHPVLTNMAMRSLFEVKIVRDLSGVTVRGLYLSQMAANGRNPSASTAAIRNPVTNKRKIQDIRRRILNLSS